MPERTVIRKEGCTGVFWDLKDYPFPDGADPVSIYKQIEQKLKDKGYHGKLSIRAFVADGFSKELVDRYREAGIEVDFFPAGDCKTARIWSMLVDILSWHLEISSRPVNLIILSKNVADDGEEEEVGASSLDVLQGLSSRYVSVVLSDPQPDWRVASDSSQWLAAFR